MPEHLVDLKDELSGHDAALLYNFWPSAKRAKMPFSIMLPGQVCTVCLGHGAGGGGCFAFVCPGVFFEERVNAGL